MCEAMYIKITTIDTLYAFLVDWTINTQDDDDDDMVKWSLCWFSVPAEDLTPVAFCGLASPITGSGGSPKSSRVLATIDPRHLYFIESFTGWIIHTWVINTAWSIQELLRHLQPLSKSGHRSLRPGTVFLGGKRSHRYSNFSPQQDCMYASAPPSLSHISKCKSVAEPCGEAVSSRGILSTQSLRLVS